MKNLIYSKRYLILGILGIIALIGLAYWYFNQSQTSNRNFTKKEKIWQTAQVQTAKDFSSIKIPAKVKSNQFAIISPRRTGIIQDLLVDIGDEVYKGQTIGSMLPEGVEGQGSAAINEASARLQKARAELAQAKGVAIDAVSVATKQWRETNLQSQTQTALEQQTKKQLTEKQSEAILVATQAWENTKLVLFGAGQNNQSNRSIRGNFSNTILKNNVENKADEIQRMEDSGQWNDPAKVTEHLTHLESFLVQAESLYKNAQTSGSLNESTIANNLGTIQTQQIRVSQVKQSILALEEKSQQFSGVQAERVAGEERSREVLDLVQSQQSLSTTQAEKNVEVAFANYNAALTRAGHQSITSPFSGIITARMVEVGQAVTPNTALMYLEGAQTARSQESLSEIHFSLPESWKNKVSVGDIVDIKSVEGETFKGKIFRLSQQINLSTNSIMATATAFEKTYEEVAIEDETEERIAEETSTEESQEKEMKEIVTPIDFEHGQSLFVYVTASGSNIFTVPTLALKKRSNNYFLWKMEEGNPVQLQVEVMAEDGEFSQVFSRELKPDGSVISNPSVSLFKKIE